MIIWQQSKKRSCILQVGRLFKTETHSVYPNPVIQIRILCQDHLCSLAFGFLLAFTQTRFRLKHHQYICVADQDVGNGRFRYLPLPASTWPILCNFHNTLWWIFCCISWHYSFCLLRLLHYIANSFPYVGISASISQPVSYHHNRPNFPCRRTLCDIWEDFVPCSRNVAPNKNTFLVLMKAKNIFEIHRIYLESQ